jgi:hypothetical protein
MRRPLVMGLVVIAALVAANIAYALTALGSRSVNLSGLPGYTLVDVLPKADAHAIPVRLKVSGNLWLSGFGRRSWFTGVVETEELEILAWERPHNAADIRTVLRAQSDEFDPAETIRFAFRDGKAERLPDYEGLRWSGTRTRLRCAFSESRERTGSRPLSAGSTVATPTSGLDPT